MHRSNKQIRDSVGSGLEDACGHVHLPTKGGCPQTELGLQLETMKEHSTTPSGGSSSSRPQASSQRLYGILLIITAFGMVTFLATFSTHHTESLSHVLPEQEYKRTVLNDFLDKEGQPAKRIQSPSHGAPEKLPKNTIQVPKGSAQNAAGKADSTPDYHLVFSTSCESQQNWESFVLYYHAYKVKQPGSVTRIASGCSNEDAQALQEFHNNYIQPLNEQFHLHLTPDFSRDKKMVGDSSRYKYMNKPYGLRHWMEETLGMNDPKHDKEVEDGIVFLMDPDMILLRPIVHDYTDEDVLFVEENPATKVVKHGMPMAQQDGYLQNTWMHLNASYITNGGNIDHIKANDGPTHYNTGPPYLATVRDMYNIAVLWTEYAPRVYEIHPKLFAEMYGFIYATTQLNLPHTLIRSLVVSTTTTNRREGWPYVDALPEAEVCSPSPGAALPIGLHYCKRYLLEKWFFSKYRLKKKYISCDTPLLKPPPLDLAARKYDFALQPPPDNHKGDWDPPRKNMTLEVAKREAFMLCHLISGVNEAAIHYKKVACPGTANMDMNYTFFTDPNMWR